MKSTKTTSSKGMFLVLTILSVAVLCFLGIMFQNGFSEESIRMNIRWSARFSVICFCFAFGASAFRYFFQNEISAWILINRKHLGISFALIHLIHLAFLFILHSNFDPVFEEGGILELTLGGLAYLFLTLMLLTSFDSFAKMLSWSNWQRLHRIGGYWILIVFSNSIIGRVVGGKLAYLPLSLLLLSVWMLRILYWNKKRISTN